MFDRIDPDHPLTTAARETNEKTVTAHLAGVFEWLGMDAAVSQIFYLAEQRAIRAFAARLFNYNMGVSGDPVKDEAIAKEVVSTSDWHYYCSTVIAAYVDGFAIGWRGHMIKEERNQNRKEPNGSV